MRGRKWGIFGALGAAGAAAVTVIALVSGGSTFTLSISGNSGTATITAAAPTGTQSVAFTMDGMTQCVDSSSPYTCAWDSTTVLDGSHSLAAVATGSFGARTSSALAVTTANSNTASLFVTPAGSDSNACTSSGSPCATLNGAFQKATDGEWISVAGGTYTNGPWTLYPNASLTTKVHVALTPGTGTVVLKDSGGTLQSVNVKASHVEFDSYKFGYQYNTGSPGTGSPPTYYYGLQIQPPSGGSGSYACISDITLKNDIGHNFSINNGVSNVTFLGGLWGLGGFQTGQHNDGSKFQSPAIGGSSSFKCPDSGTVGAPATNITFNKVLFGDNFQGCTAAAGTPANCQYPLNPCLDLGISGSSTVDCSNPSHADCLHVFGETIGLTIENSIFDRCFGEYLNLNVENTFVVDGAARFKNATIQNNYFADASPSGANTIEIGRAGPGPLYTVCDNVIFRNNTFVYTGASLISINCPVDSGATHGIQFYSNWIAKSFSSSSSCNTSAPSSVVWDYNGFASTTTACGTNTVVTADPKLTKTTDTVGDESTGFSVDFHLLVGSPLIGAGSPTDSASTNCDGNAWSGTANIGAC